MRMGKIGATFMVAAFGVTVALAVPASAHAQGLAVNGKTIGLRFPGPFGAADCVTRTITLATGNYSWRLGHQFAGEPTQTGSTATIYKTAGDYTWTDCIGEVYGGYRHTSYVTWPGGSNSAPPYTIYHPPVTLVSTWYGSSLERQ